jgi:hypothetical protein
MKQKKKNYLKLENIFNVKIYYYWSYNEWNSTELLRSLRSGEIDVNILNTNKCLNIVLLKKIFLLNCEELC